MLETATRPAGRTHDKFERLVKSAQRLPPATTAIAHPCDEVSLESAVEAARLKLIVPILVGPAARIREVAGSAELDISAFEIVDAEHSHDCAAKAVALVRAGRAEALMKGSLHTDELMAAVVARETGLRTARRISHCFIMDVPGHDDALIITDAAVNIAPTLEDKVDIVQNAIDLAHAMGVEEVRVAILSAMETVNPEGAVDARGGRAVQDGRSRPDHRRRCSTVRWRSTMRSAPRRRRSRRSSRRSPDAPTCWSCPTSRPGNMLAKSLSFLAGADAAGIVLGARVPIILTSRADALLTRLASCAVALLVAASRRAAARRGDPVRTADHERVHRRPQCRLVEHQVRALRRRADEPLLFRGQIEQIGVVAAPAGRECRRASVVAERSWPAEGFDHRGRDARDSRDAAIELLDGRPVAAVGHRVVHGGTRFRRADPDRRRGAWPRSTSWCRWRRCTSRTIWRRSRRSPRRRRTSRRSPASTPPSIAASRRWRRCSPCRASSPRPASGATASTACPTNMSRRA